MRFLLGVYIHRRDEGSGGAMSGPRPPSRSCVRRVWHVRSFLTNQSYYDQDLQGIDKHVQDMSCLSKVKVPGGGFEPRGMTLAASQNEGKRNCDWLPYRCK